MIRPDKTFAIDSHAAPAAPTPSATLQTDTESAAGTVWESETNCPFHVIMGQLSQITVKQEVLFLGGEVAPRLDLARALEGWSHLYRLVQKSVCPATREATRTEVEVATLVEATSPQLLPATYPEQLRFNLRRQLIACASCTSPQQCPLSFS